MPNGLLKILAALCLVAITWGASRAADESISPADAARIRSIIDSQISAFRSDDGAAAYSHAAPSIKQIFPSAPDFMSMVKRRYSPVYRPRAYSFEDLRRSQAGPVQRVRLVGPDGRQWLALYSFEKQADGSWKINGVFLQPASGLTI